MQRRAKKKTLKPSFRCNVAYKSHLQLTNLLPISHWHEIFGYRFFCRAVKKLGFRSEALPVTRQLTRFTRSSSNNAITHIPKRSRTVTVIYKRSFFIRACRTLNVVPAELRTNHITVASF